MDDGPEHRENAAATGEPMNVATTVPERVARVLAVVGLFVGFYQIADSSISYFAFGFTPPTLWAPLSIQLPLHYAAAVILLVAPILLLVGSIAELRRFAWGRRLMLTYAWMWLAMCVLYALERIPDVLWGSFSTSLTGWQRVQFVSSGLGTAVYGSVLPLVILAFRNVGRIVPAAPTYRGFEPIISPPETPAR